MSKELLDIYLPIPAGAKFFNMLRNESAITLQFWVTPEAKQTLMTMLTSGGMPREYSRSGAVEEAREEAGDPV